MLIAARGKWQRALRLRFLRISRFIAAMPTADERRRIAAIARGLERFTERAVIKTGLGFTRNIVESSGADTGRLRTNLVPPVGSPRTETLASARRPARTSPIVRRGPRARRRHSAIANRPDGLAG